MPTSKIIKSYPYLQFSDDANIAAWFSAGNSYAQKYLDWLNNTPLAIYTNSSISGDFLDWVANGIYGVYRVPIPTFQARTYGALNTYTPNSLELNSGGTVENGSAQTMTDDILKRLITWNFYKGDGTQLTIPWIKRRVARFLYGINGFADTQGISVRFTDVKSMSITITGSATTIALAQQLNNLIQSRIPNFPTGYAVTMTWTTPG